MYSLFADESNCKDTGHVIVAGFLIGSKALERLTDAWKMVLERACLSYFHMKEGHHTSHPDVYSELTDLITYEHVIAGFCASVVQNEYDSIFSRKRPGHRKGKAEQPLKYWVGGSYSFCTGAIAQLANQWLDANNPEEKDMAYIFDAGNEKEHEADMFLRMIGSDPFLKERKRKLRYYSHAFVDSKRQDGGALQAADMLAWNIAYRQRTKNWNYSGSRIIETINVNSVHYGERGLLATIENQERFWQEYGSLRRANVLNLHGTMES